MEVGRDENSIKAVKNNLFVVNNVIVHKVEKKQQQSASIKYRETPLKVVNNERDTTFQFVRDFSEIFKNPKKN